MYVCMYVCSDRCLSVCPVHSDGPTWQSCTGCEEGSRTKKLNVCMYVCMRICMCSSYEAFKARAAPQPQKISPTYTQHGEKFKLKQTYMHVNMYVCMYVCRYACEQNKDNCMYVCIRNPTHTTRGHTYIHIHTIHDIQYMTYIHSTAPVKPAGGFPSRSRAPPPTAAARTRPYSATRRPPDRCPCGPGATSAGSAGTPSQRYHIHTHTYIHIHTVHQVNG